MKRFFTTLNRLFAAPQTGDAYQTEVLAKEAKQGFSVLECLIKKGQNAAAESRRLAADHEQFLQDNEGMQVDQNVGRNTDNQRAYWVLFGVMMIGIIFSVKGLKFFLGEFYNISSYWVILPFALLLSAVLVIGSIHLNHFAEQQREKSKLMFFHAKLAAYTIVFFLPVVNLIEGINAEYDPLIMGLNVILSLVDMMAHTALVSMHNTFITAENSKNAIKRLRQKEKVRQKADKALQSLQEEFTKAKNGFNEKATQLVYHYKKLEAENTQAAEQVLFLLTNFLIWMINNKVYQHQILPYHTNENGQPVVEGGYFHAALDTISRGWDQLSVAKGHAHQPIADEALPNETGQGGYLPQPNPISTDNESLPHSFDELVEEGISNEQEKFV